MNWMSRSRGWKRVVLAGLGALVVLDLGLGILLWQLRQTDPTDLSRQRTALETKAKLLKADVARGQAIRNEMPKVGEQAGEFYEQQLPPSTAGYSALVADLGEIAEKAGLRTSSTSFQDHLLQERGVTEIQIQETVEGDYASVLKYIAGLERSRNFYLLSDLGLDSSETGVLHLKLVLKTYFRT
jgi:Tfp pilus assembly protein PilO